MALYFLYLRAGTNELLDLEGQECAPYPLSARPFWQLCETS